MITGFWPNLYTITQYTCALDTQCLDENSPVESLVSLHVLSNYAFRTQVTLDIAMAIVNISDVLLKTILHNSFSTKVTIFFRFCFVLSFAPDSSMRGNVSNLK